MARLITDLKTRRHSADKAGGISDFYLQPAYPMSSRLNALI